MRLEGLLKLLIGVSFASALAAWWIKDLPPEPALLQGDALEEPLQARTRKAPFNTSVNGIDYRVEPRYSYELNGVVVSLHHTDTWWNYAHKQWGDYVNVMDLCVV